MSRPIVIVTDSSSDIVPSVGAAHGVDVLPLWVVAGGKRLRDEIDLSRDQFYSLLLPSKQLPFTEPVDTEAFAAVFSERVGLEYDVLAILISSGISKSYENALAAATPFGEKVHVVDSASASGGLRLQVQAAAEMAQSGRDLAEIVAELRQIKRSQAGYFVTPDLSHLGRSGRIPKGIVMLGNVLKVSPVLEFREGKIALAAQLRTHERAKEYLAEIATRNLSVPDRMRFIIGHGRAPESAGDLMVEIRKRLARPPRSIETCEFGPGTALHAGPGALAVFSIVGPP